MKLWELYIAEREGAKLICTEHSFVTYRNIEDNSLMVVDLFVEKEHRKSGLIRKMWNEMIEKEKPKMVYGTTDVSALNWETSHQFMVSFGFTPYTQEDTIIHYYREIDNG